MSQTELGDQIGVTFQQVQKYESGSNRVSIGRLVRIANALGVPSSFLLTGKGLPQPKLKDAGRFEFLAVEGALRLVKAYSRLKNRGAAAALVKLADSLAKPKSNVRN